jgi:hypothetical protein
MYNKPKTWDTKINLQGINGANATITLKKTTIENLSSDFKDQELAIMMPDGKYSDNTVYKLDKLIEFDKDIWKIGSDVILITKAKKQDAYKSLLAKYYIQLYVLLQLAETYPNKAALEKSSHIWKYYQMNRK